jgi:hypothetical protein
MITVLLQLLLQAPFSGDIPEGFSRSPIAGRTDTPGSRSAWRRSRQAERAHLVGEAQPPVVPNGPPPAMRTRVARGRKTGF